MASEPKSRLSDLFRSCLPRTKSRNVSHTSTPSADDIALPTEIVSAEVAPAPTMPPVTESAPQEGKIEHMATIDTLKQILMLLEPSLAGLPPIQLAGMRYESNDDTMQVEEHNRQAYEEIILNLTHLATLLQKHAVGSNPRNVSYSVANVARAIREQTMYIKRQQDRTRLSRLAMAKNDEEDVRRCYQRIGALFQHLQADISLSTWDEIREQQMNTQLKDLLPAHEAHYDAALSAVVTKRFRCTKNTRVQILEDVWLWACEDDVTRIYWMNGMAGTGKTTIAYTLCEMLHEAKQLGASFFCSRNSPDCRDVNKIVPTIAYQLGRYSNPYRQALCNELTDDPDVAKRSIITQFKHLITKPLTKIGQAMPKDVIVMIDGLDECTDLDGTKSILEMLLQNSGDLPIKFFITSRPEPTISDSMTARDGAWRPILQLHTIKKALVQADIKTYLVEGLKSVQISESDIDRLCSLAGSLFIFAATAVRYIAMNHNAVDRQERLHNVLGNHNGGGDIHYKELDSLYRTILAKALDKDVLEKKEVERRRRVLRTVVCARESLSPATLSELLAIGTEQQVTLAIQSLQSVLHTSDGTDAVSVLHASFTDFLLTQDRSREFFCDPHDHNRYLVLRCFSHMDRLLRFNICNIETSYQLDREVPDLETRVRESISPGLFYACQYWSDHVVSTQSSTELLSLLGRFLQHHLLFWMEVLSLKQWSSYGEGMLSKVVDWLLACNLIELMDFAHDARNFVTSFAANACSLSTPHIYLSVLPFMSRQNRVWQTYWPRMRGLIRVEGPGMEARGKSPLATWAVGSSVKSLALTKDGKRVVSGSGNHEVSVWDVASGTRILGPLKGHENIVWSVAYSSNDAFIASGSWDNTIRIWHAQKGELITGPLRGHGSQIIRSIAFSPDGFHLASGSEDRTVQIWDVHSGALVGDPLHGHQNYVMSIAFSPDGQHLASGSYDTTIRVWDWKNSLMAQLQLEGHTDAVWSVAYSRDGHRLVSGSADQMVRVWDMSNGTLLAGPFANHTNTVSCVSFSPNGTQIVSGSWDGTIRVWEALSGILAAGAFMGHGHGSYVNSVLFTADGTRILSGSDDHTIFVWDARHSTTGTMQPTGHTRVIRSVALSPSGTRAASGSSDHTICIWDTQSGALVAGPLQGHADIVNSVAFSHDGARIVSGSRDRTLRTWDASTGAVLISPIEGHTDSVKWVVFSPDGSRIASGSSDMTIRMWNSQTGESVADPFRGHTNLVASIAFSPDGARLVSGSWDYTVRMWDANDGAVLWASEAHKGIVCCVAFSPDGTRLVSGSRDLSILVLDVRDGAVMHGPFTGHTKWVSSVAFSPDGTRIVSGSVDRTVRVWDVESGTVVAGPLERHTDSVGSAAFSPDGTLIISGSFDRTIRVWNLAAIIQASPSSNDWSIDDDGWLTNSHSQRLFWVPSDLRARFGFLTAANPIVMNADCTTQIDHSTLLGNRWHECYGVSSESASF